MNIELCTLFIEKIGENVEPLELEEAALKSPLIQQIVVIGQVPFFLISISNAALAPHGLQLLLYC